MRHFFDIMKTEQIYELFRKSEGVTTDSRSVGKGQIFFALKGGNFNGNLFAEKALEQGAAWAVIDDPRFETGRTILVDDCLRELQALATYHRKQMNVPVLAITGTNGKTTTKELTALTLSKKYKVHYTKGNLNNHIGVPLTILSAPDDTELMIIEMGANHQGEIKELSLIARPDYGIITNIGTAHLEGFGSFEGVVRTKTELYDFLRSENGIAIYNDCDPLLTAKVAEYGIKAVPYSNPADLPLDIKEDQSAMNLVVKMTYNLQKFTIRTNLFGSYNLWNVKAAFAAGLYFEIRIENIIDAIEQYNPANNRSQVRITKRNTLICDSYNANPSSMHLAISSFSALRNSPKMAILGDMLELGERSPEEHKKILDELEKLKPGKVLLTGKMFGKISEGRGFMSFPDVQALAAYLKNEDINGFTILIKGSRGIGLEKVYDLL